MVPPLDRPPGAVEMKQTPRWQRWAAFVIASTFIAVLTVLASVLWLGPEAGSSDRRGDRNGSTGSSIGATDDPPTVTDQPSYLTIMIGRAEWTAAKGCKPLEGAVPLDRVADVLRQRDLTATAGVVPSLVGDVERTCDSGFALRSSWADMARLRDQYAWTFVPRSTGDLASMSDERRMAETCGSAAALDARGHTGAWGLFAYANNAKDDTVQEQLVATCFAFGRSYGSGVTQRASLGPPWWQSTRSVNGGRCADDSLPCATAKTSKDTKYEGPELLAGFMKAAPNTWRTVQLYRFVEGRSPPGDQSWDCTGPDWRTHWTSRAELYCFNDFVAALDSVDPGTTVVDPATVALAWDRRLPGR